MDFIFGGFQDVVFGEVSTSKLGADEASCGRSMNTQIEPDQFENFHQRLNEWISKQGFWLQLRYTLSGESTKGTFTFHLLRIATRILVFLVLLAVGFIIFLTKQPNTDSFLADLRTTFIKRLNADEYQMSGLTSHRGQLMIGRLAMTGKAGTFFSDLDIRNMICKRSLFASFQKEWDPGTVTISQMDMSLHAGAESREAAESMASVYFQDTGKLKLEKIVVKKMSMMWGFTESTRGSIIGSQMTADRLPEGWKLRFRGGTFSQNFFRQLTIEEMVVQFGRKGLIIEKATFKKSTGTVKLLDVKVKAGVEPEVSGKVVLHNIVLSSLVPPYVNNFVEGQISGELNMSGLTNSGDGICFEGNLVLEGEDYIMIRDRIHILRAISLIDSHNDYKRVDFREGGFHLKALEGMLEITGAKLKADNLFTMQGSMTARPATNEESTELSASVSLDDKQIMLEDYDSNTSLEMYSEGAGRQVNEAKRQRFANTDEETLFHKLEFTLQKRKDEAFGLQNSIQKARYEGEFEVSLPKETFDNAGKLSEIYPLRDQAGRILLRVPLEGGIQDLTLKQSEDIYKYSAR